MCHNHTQYSWLACLALPLVYVIGPGSAVAQDESLNSMASPFAVDASAGRHGEEIVLAYDSATSYAQLQARYDSRKPFHLTGFPLTEYRQVSLTLRPISVMSAGANVLVVKDEGTVSLAPQVLTFSGYLTDVPRSYVFMAFSPKMVNGYFADRDTLYILSSGDPREITPGRAVLADAGTFLSGSPSHDWTCQVLLPAFQGHAPKPVRSDKAGH